MWLQPVDGAQQRALARAGGADDHGDFAGVECGRNVLEHLVRAEGLADLVGDDVALLRVFGECWLLCAHLTRPSTSKRYSMAAATCVTRVVRIR
ncbi:hypothetical protein SDC9_120017 [bioreactor metagenome]|uniref:Uncharacterized protein n=1 Tax=bioreactor metagenome TaxID=1076179 RepID=A0A645C7N5_9ZZZZ